MTFLSRHCTLSFAPLLSTVFRRFVGACPISHPFGDGTQQGLEFSRETLQQLPELEVPLSNDLETADPHRAPELKPLRGQRGPANWDVPDLACDLSALPSVAVVALDSRQLFYSGLENRLYQSTQVSFQRHGIRNSQIGQVTIRFNFNSVLSDSKRSLYPIRFTVRYHHLAVFNQTMDKILVSTSVDDLDFETGQQYAPFFHAAVRNCFGIFPIERSFFTVAFLIWMLACWFDSWQLRKYKETLFRSLSGF